MTVLLAYIFYFITASASPLQRRWLAVKDPGGGQIDFSFRNSLIISVCGLGLIPFFPPELSGNPLHIALLAAVCGLSGIGFWIGNYSAQRHVDAGITTLVSNIYTPVSILLATFFLQESLTLKQLAGTVLLLFAIVLVAKKHRLGKFKFDKYFMLMVMSGVMLGILITAERGLMKTTGFTTGVLISWWVQCGTLFILKTVLKNKTTYNLKQTLITGGLRFAQALGFVLLVNLVSNLSVVSAITTFKIVVIFIFAAIFLGERDDIIRKSLGSIIALAGLLLMK